MATEALRPQVVVPIVVGGLHPSMQQLLADLQRGVREAQRLRVTIAEDLARLRPGVEQALAVLSATLAAPETLKGLEVAEVAELVASVTATQERYTRMTLQLAKATDADARLHQLLSGEPDSRAAKTLDECSDAELERLVRAAHARLEARPAVRAVTAGEPPQDG